MNEQKRRRGRIIVISVVVVLLVLAGVGIWAAYAYDNDWTGFQDYQSGTPEAERGKTLWDWLELLIIPAVLALGALWVNWISQRNEQRRADRENQIEREIASERNQEAALQNYLDKMTELLLEKDLRASQSDDEVRTVARTRTLTVLRGLDIERKASVVQFLIEAGLLAPQMANNEIIAPVVSLQEADLSRTNLLGTDLHGADLVIANLSDACLRIANLSRASLKGANLQQVDLREANLSEANLHVAQLNGSDLSQARLNRANLSGAKLIGAVLCNANLTNTNLRRADLRGANLRGANLRGANLRETDLRKANLMMADLHGADLRGADLRKVILPALIGDAINYDMSEFGVKYGPELTGIENDE